MKKNKTFTPSVKTISPVGKELSENGLVYKTALAYGALTLRKK